VRERRKNSRGNLQLNLARKTKNKKTKQKNDGHVGKKRGKREWRKGRCEKGWMSTIVNVFNIRRQSPFDAEHVLRREKKKG